MAVSEAALKENYRRYSDDKLLRIAAEDATKLRPEALVLLKEELHTRGLGETAEKIVAAQFRVFSEEEIAEYCELLQAQPCPHLSFVSPAPQCYAESQGDELFNNDNLENAVCYCLPGLPG